MYLSQNLFMFNKILSESESNEAFFSVNQTFMAAIFANMPSIVMMITRKSLWE